jgi:hypothetical protein
VNTIHSSSLTFTPTGYVKPEQESFSKKPVNTVVSSDNSGNKRIPTSISTPEQVKTALSKSGLNKQDTFNPGDNTRTNKALQTYAETRNQPAQTQLETLISRVDYYA